MSKSYEAVWDHIDSCSSCDRDLRRLCPEGRDRLDEATQATAAQLAPMPTTVWFVNKPAGMQ